MKTSLENSDRDFLKLLQRMGRGTIHEICDELGVTATAIRQRLVRLHSSGCVARELVREGRGRPHHVYFVTAVGQRALGDNYGDLALILWRELQNIDHPQVRAAVESRVRQALVTAFGGSMTGGAVHDRFRKLGAALADRGYDVEVDEKQELPILRENTCPYHELADCDRGICEMEEQVFEAVLGMPVRLRQCFLDGHNCCEFEPAPVGSVEGAD